MVCRTWMYGFIFIDVADEVGCRETLKDHDQQILDQQKLEQLQHLYSKSVDIGNNDTYCKDIGAVAAHQISVTIASTATDT